MQQNSEVRRRGASNKGRRFSGTWATLSTLIRKGHHHSHVAQMSEGRRSQVVLLDERRLDLIIQSRLYAGELLDIVASHFNLKEKEYFGISFIDDTGQYSWLQLDKRVLEHDFPKKSSSQGSTLTFYFRIKYFVESITQLRDSATIEAFYLQTKSLLGKGELEIDSETVFQLAALVIQATYGDYLDDLNFKLQLKKLPVLPASTLKENPSISVCEEKVLEHYQELTGQTRGAAIVNYLSIVESLPTYGQHFYEVKDKSGTPCCLGLSYRGISQYDKNDQRTPTRVFLWKQLENLYFRDNKFTIEVHEARRVIHTLSSFNLYEDAIEEPVEEFDSLSNAICDPTTQVSVSRRTLAPANVTVYVWYAASPLIAKCIWSMAISQHQFFLDRSHRKGRDRTVRSLSQIASELCRSVQSLSSASSQSNISRSTSSNSLPTIVIEGELSEESKAATIEMLTALQSRREALQDALKKKTEELKSLCLKEGEITGELPPETPFHPGEAQPQVRRRIGTSFTLSDKFMCRAKGNERETLNDLELDYEIQSKIASAAFKLANDVTARKSVRKIRKISYQQATTKLRDIEQKLCTLKREKDTQKRDNLASKCSSDDSRVNLGLAASTSEGSISERSNFSSNQNNVSASVLPSISLPQLTCATFNSAPPSPAKSRHRHQSLQHSPAIATDVYEDIALPFEVQAKRNSSSYSAASEYDTVSCGSSSIASLGIPYRNRFEANLNIEGTNHYSVPNRRASQVFNDPDELLLDARTNNPSQCSERYSNTIPLSSSYNESVAYPKSTSFLSNPEARQSHDSTCDNRSIASGGALSSGCSDYKLSVPNELSRLAHSENSLHRTKANSLHHNLDQVHISDPDLSLDNVHGAAATTRGHHMYTMPALRNRGNYVQHQRSSPILIPADYPSSQSISQVADLVQASVLLQDCKRAASASSLEFCSPKAKTKEWIETSLDSPVVTRKQRKPKLLDSTYNADNHPLQWQENGLPDPPVTDVFSASCTHSEFYEPYQDYSPCNTFKQHETPPSTPHPPNQSELLQLTPNYSDYSPSGTFKINDTPPLSPQPSFSSPMNAEYPLEEMHLRSNRNSSRCLFPTLAPEARHYENTADLSNDRSSIQPSPFYSTIQETAVFAPVSSGSSVALEIPKRQMIEPSFCLPVEKPIPHHSIAEPQQPPRNITVRRQKMSNDYSMLNSSDMNDYQDIDVPTVYSYESPVYCEIPLAVPYSQVHLEQKNQHVSSHPYISCDKSRQSPNINESHEVPNWQQTRVSSPVQSGAIELKHQHLSNNVYHISEKNIQSPNGNESHDALSWQQSQVSSTRDKEGFALTSPRTANLNFSPNVEVNVVSVGHFQPYWEETKPYELSDFYKYSTKHRKQSKRSKEATESSATAVVDNHTTDSNMCTSHGAIFARAEVMSHDRGGNNSSQGNNYSVISPVQAQEMAVSGSSSEISPYDGVIRREKTLRYSDGKAVTHSPLNHSSDGDKSTSFGEAEFRISLADTFHEEMLAWYQNQDSVKKATLV